MYDAYQGFGGQGRLGIKLYHGLIKRGYFFSLSFHFPCKLCQLQDPFCLLDMFLV